MLTSTASMFARSKDQGHLRVRHGAVSRSRAESARRNPSSQAPEEGQRDGGNAGREPLAPMPAGKRAVGMASEIPFREGVCGQLYEQL